MRETQYTQKLGNLEEDEALTRRILLSVSAWALTSLSSAIILDRSCTKPPPIQNIDTKWKIKTLIRGKQRGAKPCLKEGGYPTFRAWLRASFSACDSMSWVRFSDRDFDTSESLVSISSRSLSNSLVFFTMVSCRCFSCSSRPPRSCCMISFNAPSRCFARSSVSSRCLVTVSSSALNSAASFSAFSQPEKPHKNGLAG